MVAEDPSTGLAIFAFLRAYLSIYRLTAKCNSNPEFKQDIQLLKSKGTSEIDSPYSFPLIHWMKACQKISAPSRPKTHSNAIN